MSAVDGKADYFLPIMHWSDGPQRSPLCQGEEVLAAWHVRKEIALHLLCVVVTPRWPLKGLVELHNRLFAFLFMKEENYRKGRLRIDSPIMFRRLPRPAPFCNPEELEIWVDP